MLLIYKSELSLIKFCNNELNFRINFCIKYIIKYIYKLLIIFVRGDYEIENK